MTEQSTKNGEAFYRDELGALWLAESWIEANGETYTTHVEVEPASTTLPPSESNVNG